MNTTAFDCNKFIDPGQTAWVNVCVIFVLGMVPGLAFYEAGLLRKKNVVSIMSQIFIGLVITSMMWTFFGFSLVLFCLIYLGSW